MSEALRLEDLYKKEADLFNQIKHIQKLISVYGGAVRKITMPRRPQVFKNISTVKLEEMFSLGDRVKVRKDSWSKHHPHLEEREYSIVGFKDKTGGVKILLDGAKTYQIYHWSSLMKVETKCEHTGGADPECRCRE